MVLKEYRGSLNPNGGVDYTVIDLRDKKYIRIVEFDVMMPIGATLADNDHNQFQIIKGSVATQTTLSDSALLLNFGFYVHMAAEGILAPKNWSAKGSVKGVVIDCLTVIFYAATNETFHYRLLLDVNEAR